MFKLTKPLLAFLLALLVVAGCAPGNNNNVNDNSNDNNIVDIVPAEDPVILSQEEVPEIILAHVDLNTEGYYAFQLEDELYLVATMGERPTGGYSIAFTRHQDNRDHTWNAFFMTDEPGPDEQVTQALTYPASFVLFEEELPIFHVQFYLNDVPTEIVTVVDLNAPNSNESPDNQTEQPL